MLLTLCVIEYQQVEYIYQEVKEYITKKEESLRLDMRSKMTLMKNQ